MLVERLAPDALDGAGIDTEYADPRFRFDQRASAQEVQVGYPPATLKLRVDCNSVAHDSTPTG